MEIAVQVNPPPVDVAVQCNQPVEMAIQTDVEVPPTSPVPFVSTIRTVTEMKRQPLQSASDSLDDIFEDDDLELLEPTASKTAKEMTDTDDELDSDLEELVEKVDIEIHLPLMHCARESQQKCKLEKEIKTAVKLIRQEARPKWIQPFKPPLLKTCHI